MIWILTHLIAFWAGGLVMLFAVALCSSAKRADEAMEKWNEQRTNRQY